MDKCKGALTALLLPYTILAKVAALMPPIGWITLGTVVMIVIGFISAGVIHGDYEAGDVAAEQLFATATEPRTDFLGNIFFDHLEMGVAIAAFGMTFIQVICHFSNCVGDRAAANINKMCIVLCAIGCILWFADAINDIVEIENNKANLGIGSYMDNLDVSSGIIGLAGLSSHKRIGEELNARIIEGQNEQARDEESIRNWKWIEERSQSGTSTYHTYNGNKRQFEKLQNYEMGIALSADTFLMVLALVGTIGFNGTGFPACEQNNHFMRAAVFSGISAFVGIVVGALYLFQFNEICLMTPREVPESKADFIEPTPSNVTTQNEERKEQAIELANWRDHDDEEVTLSDGSSHSGNETGEDSQNVGRNIAHRRSSMFTQAQAQQLALARAQALINEQKEEAGSEEKSVNEPSRTAQPETSLNLSSRRSQGEPERSRTVLQEEASLNLSSRRSQVHPVPAEETAESSRTREELEEQPASLDSTPANSYDGQSPQRAQQSPGATPDGNTSGTDESHRRLLPIDKLFAEIMA